MITQILESKGYSEKALEIYESLGRVLETSSPNKETEILVIRLAYKIDKEYLDKFSKLKVIAAPITGLNKIDLKACEKRSIKVISLKGESKWLGKNITSTAEHTFALLLSLIRSIPSAFMDVKRGHWDRDSFKGLQLKDKTLGILGYGRIGKQVAKLAKSFQMKVIWYDKKNIKGKGLVGLQELFELSDILTIHIDLNDSNYNLVNDLLIKRMKPSALLINTSRGEVIDEQDLLLALKRKEIAGAALDVLWDESADGKHLKDNLLVEYAKTHDNLLLTPHLGGATKEAMHLTEEKIAEDVYGYIKKYEDMV